MRAWVWPALCLSLALLALLAWALPSEALDWQPALFSSQPWRAWSGALVHWSGQHLRANLAGTAVLALLGWAARLEGRCALAWLLAWPLTQIGLLAEPGLLHFGGLSGVLHAGVAVAMVELLRRAGGTWRERSIGALIGLGLLIKLWLEAPLAGPPLRQVAGWDIAIAPLAHLTGCLAGLLCGLLVPRPHPPATLLTQGEERSR